MVSCAPTIQLRNTIQASISNAGSGCTFAVPRHSFFDNRTDDSPDEKDPYFPYMEEVAGNIIFKQDEKAQFEPNDQINTIWLQEECDPGYFADTENEPLEYSGNDCISFEICGNSLVDSSCFSELLVDISESNGNDSISANSTNNSFLLHDTCLPGRNGNDSISMNSTLLNRISNHDPLPQINLQEYGDPKLFENAESRMQVKGQN